MGQPHAAVWNRFHKGIIILLHTIHQANMLLFHDISGCFSLQSWGLIDIKYFSWQTIIFRHLKNPKKHLFFYFYCQLKCFHPKWAKPFQRLSTLKCCSTNFQQQQHFHPGIKTAGTEISLWTFLTTSECRPIITAYCSWLKYILIFKTESFALDVGSLSNKEALCLLPFNPVWL